MDKKNIFTIVKRQKNTSTGATKGAKDTMDANNKKTIKQMDQHSNNTQVEKHNTSFTFQNKPLK